MKIQVNTDKNIDGKEDLIYYIENLFADKLKRFDAHLTRIEIHLSDENAGKGGSDDKKCSVEARMDGHEPIFARAQSDTMHISINDALQKIKRGIEHLYDKANA
jgi:ribosomal subunit interface protein